MTPARNKSIILSTLAAAALWPAALCVAQSQAGSDGHALDASQQVGSGGYNDRSNRLDYRLRNDLVTGNVGAGKSFQGDVGYSAPGEFQGELQSDTLFQYQRDSFQSSTGAIGQPGRLPSGGSSIYRGYTTVPGYRLEGRQAYTTVGQSAGGGYQVVEPSTGYASRVEPLVVTSSNALPGRTQGDTNKLGIFTQPDGSRIGIEASPLLGLRHVPLDRTEQQLLGRDLLAPEPEADDATLDQYAPDLGSEMRIDANVDKLKRELQPDYELFQPNTGSMLPTLVIGQQIRSQVYGELSDTQVESLEQRASRLRDVIYSPLGSRMAAEPGRDAYLDLLRAIRDQGEAKTEGTRQVTAVQPDEALRNLLEEPSPEDVEQAEQQRDMAVEQAIGEGAAEQPGEVTAESLKQLIDELNYELPPLESLAGGREDRVNQRMKDAESALVAGKYLSAESLYQRVLTEDPNLTMARTGLIHAQLGGGMIRSAAYGLRQQFEKHPELIAARYADNLLPSGDRLQWVQNELQQMINDANSPGDAGLMLAYLGYQVGSKQLIRYGLAVTEGADPNDALVPVLRRIWLDETREQ